MRATAALTLTVLAASATAAWGHPGHGAEGETHHFVDLLALGAIAIVFALVWASRGHGGKDHD